MVSSCEHNNELIL